MITLSKEVLNGNRDMHTEETDLYRERFSTVNAITRGLREKTAGDLNMASTAL